MGAILAGIHMTDFSGLGFKDGERDHAKFIDWNHYLHKGRESQVVWIDLFSETVENLYEWCDLANYAAKMLASDRVISRGDLEPKNVMWVQENPIIIDWESAGYIHPMQDMVETVIYGSKDEAGNTNKEKFSAFVKGYRSRYGALQANWQMVLASGFSGTLGWLEYSLRRSLWLACTDEKEQQMGTAQVTDTIIALRRYAK